MEVVLLDGKMMGFRAHYSHLALRSKSGEPTGMYHGFLVELMQIHKTLPEAAIVVCWDGKGKTWRHGVFREYKANRSRNPEYKNLITQSEMLMPALEDLGLKVACVPGVEADDMLGMLATSLSKNFLVRVYSKDRDMYQLASERVCIWPEYKQKPMTVKDIEKWLGAPFEALMEIRAMAGDAGDNLKGLPGIGYTRARHLWKGGVTLSTIHHGFESTDWERVQNEYRLALIVRDVNSFRWTDVQKLKLGQLVHAVCRQPGRDRDLAEARKSRFYEFLGRYELEEIFKNRARLYAIP
jgi:DNA polymerase-1